MDTKSFVKSAQAQPEALAKGQEALQGILARSATDREFRQKLLTDPRAALAEYTGQDAPGVDIRFVENTATATIVLPDFADGSAELSESELEAVAGGATPALVLWAIAGVATGAGAYAIGDAMR